MSFTNWVTGVVTFSLMCSLCLASAAEKTKENPGARSVRILGEALRQGKEKKPATEKQVYLKALNRVSRLLTNNVLVTDNLKRALTRVKTMREDEKATAFLRAKVRETIAILRFKPISEGKLPEGFPSPTPVGEIRVKSYPVYRLARADMKNRNNTFWTLFRHIKKNNIAMTVPVEMTYKTPEGKQPKAEAMAFLYRTRKLGKPGKDGRVEVSDIPALKTVSVGMLGDSNDTQVARARKWLEAWMKANPEYQKAGSLRVMVYNSPMGPAGLRFWELEIPIKLAKGSSR